MTVLLTHLCHKPVGGGDRDSAVQQPIWQPPQAWAVLFCPDRVPGTGGADEHLPSTVAISSLRSAARRHLGRSRRARPPESGIDGDLDSRIEF